MTFSRYSKYLLSCMPMISSLSGYCAPNNNQFTPSTTQAIRLFEDRVKDNPHDDANLLMLAQLQIRSAREGNSAAYHQAEHSLEAAIKVNPTNQKARALLASTLNSQHEFKEAITIAKELQNSSEKDVRLMALSVLGDAYLELGQINTAKKLFMLLHKEAPDAPQVLSRQAGVAELSGDVNIASSLLQKAVSIERMSSQTGADLAWYLTQLGELKVKSGDFKKAAIHFQEALNAFPNFPGAVRGQAIVATAHGDTARAIDLYWKLLELGGDPMLAYSPLAELYRMKKNDSAYKKVVADVLDLARHVDAHHHDHTHDHKSSSGVSSDKHDHIHERALAQFLVDNNLQVDRAVHLMEHEVEKRKDPHTLDALAWAYFRNGDSGKASKQYQDILAQGTKDPLILFHAGSVFKTSSHGAISSKGRKLMEESMPALRGLHPTAKTSL
jgi:tetratricopeptide (TPR) repeat protein